MAKWSQRATYEALQARLAGLDLELLLGVPRALQRVPAAYLSSVTVAVTAGKFGSVNYRPTLTLAVNWQENSAAELQLVDLVDYVAGELMLAPLAGVCRCTVETVNYDWRTVAGIDYRVADLILVLTNI